jgi:hypothetical protein
LTEAQLQLGERQEAQTAQRNAHPIELRKDDGLFRRAYNYDSYCKRSSPSTQRHDPLMSYHCQFIHFRKRTLPVFVSLKFPRRSPEQEKQFQIELSMFYSVVLRNSAPLILPIPPENEMWVGNWVVRNPVVKGIAQA